MKKILYAMALLVLTSCTLNSAENKLSVALNDVEYMGNSLVLHLYFERPDLNLKQAVSEALIDKNDLPKELIVEKTSLTEINPDPNFGMNLNCETEKYPVTCRINFSQEDYVSFANKMPSREFKINAKFMDGFEGETQILVPFISPYNLAYPKIMEPLEDSKSKNILVFKDAGLDTYIVNLSLCYEQDGDIFVGAEQCLNIPEYVLSKENNLFTVKYDENYYPAVLNQRTDEIKLEFDMDPGKYDFIYYRISSPQKVKTFLGTWFKFELSDESKVYLN